MALTKVGLQKTTLLDFPGEVAATVFTPGCNLRCPYCHNPSLVRPPFPDDMISLAELDHFLEKRSNVLGGVCITGGEPLIHENLDDLINIIHRHGLKVKLDTNGTFPERLALAEVEYIAMDLKTTPEKYDALLGSKASSQVNTAAKIKASVKHLKSSGIPYELRTTVVPGIVGPEDLEAMLPLLKGCRYYRLNPFRQGETLDPAFATISPPTDDLMTQLRQITENYGITAE